MASTEEKPAKKKTTTKAKAPAGKTTNTRATRRRHAPTHEAIAQRAYELYLAQGGGDTVSHWHQAERELADT